MQVAILAGGLATRLKPLTNRLPKSLVAVWGRPFLAYQLDFIKSNGIRDVVLCVGYQGESIERHFGDGTKLGLNISYSYENERLLGTAGALKNAEPLLEDNFFVMYGDSYLFLNLASVWAYFNGFSRLGLMVVYQNYNRYDRSNVAVDGNLVKQYSKQNRTRDMVYIDYGVSLLKKRALELVPADHVYSLEALFQQLIQERELLAYEANMRFYEIGSLQGLGEFRELVWQGGVL